MPLPGWLLAAVSKLPVNGQRVNDPGSCDHCSIVFDFFFFPSLFPLKNENHSWLKTKTPILGHTK